MATKQPKKHNNQPKTSGLDGGGCDWMRERGGMRGTLIRSFWGQTSLITSKNDDKINHFIKLFFFSAG